MLGKSKDEQVECDSQVATRDTGLAIRGLAHHAVDCWPSIDHFPAG